MLAPVTSMHAPLKGLALMVAFCAASIGAPVLATESAAAAPQFTRVAANPAPTPVGALLEEKVQASDGAAGDHFSYSVAISGITAVVGASDAAIGGTSGQGAVYVFTRSGDTWSEVQKLVADDGAMDDGFGFSVSISGGTILAGAPYATVGGNGGQGAAYVFNQAGGVWTQTQKLTADDGGPSNNFGWSVSVSGSNALISSPVAPVGQNALQGKAYIFTEANDMWSQSQTLTADDGTAFADFGYSVSLDGSTAVIGASGVDNYFGAAYIFEGSGGMWTQTAELLPDDGVAGEFFGISVAVSGANAIVGAYYQNEDPNMHQGAAYIFSNSGGIWAQAQKLTATEGAANDRFGLSVALEGSTALVGAYYVDAHQGAAYLFREDAGMWNETAELQASDGAADDEFGNQVAISGDSVIVGAFDADMQQGAAYLYTRPPAADTIFRNGFDIVP